jgi:hypothetical protein
LSGDSEEGREDKGLPSGEGDWVEAIQEGLTSHQRQPKRSVGIATDLQQGGRADPKMADFLV